MRHGPWNAYEQERRETQASGGRIFGIVVSTGLAFLAGRYLFSADPADDGQSRAQEFQAAPRPPEVREFSSSAPERRPEIPAMIQRPTNARTLNVYECFVDGQRVLSDQRCADDARERVVTVTRPDPRDVALAQRRAAELQLRGKYRLPSVTQRSSSSRSGGASYGSDNSSSCADVDRRIEWINARMRQGYTSQEGEWLRDDLRALKQERWNLRCGR